MSDKISRIQEKDCSMIQNERHNIVHVMGNMEDLISLNGAILWGIENMEGFDPNPPQFLIANDDDGVLEFVLFTSDNIEAVQNLIQAMSKDFGKLIFRLSSGIDDVTEDRVFVNGTMQK